MSARFAGPDWTGGRGQHEPPGTPVPLPIPATGLREDRRGVRGGCPFAAVVNPLASAGPEPCFFKPRCKRINTFPPFAVAFFLDAFDDLFCQPDEFGRRCRLSAALGCVLRLESIVRTAGRHQFEPIADRRHLGFGIREFDGNRRQREGLASTAQWYADRSEVFRGRPVLLAANGCLHGLLQQ